MERYTRSRRQSHLWKRSYTCIIALSVELGATKFSSSNKIKRLSSGGTLLPTQDLQVFAKLET